MQSDSAKQCHSTTGNCSKKKSFFSLDNIDGPAKFKTKLLCYFNCCTFSCSSRTSDKHEQLIFCANFIQVFNKLCLYFVCWCFIKLLFICSKIPFIIGIRFWTIIQQIQQKWTANDFISNILDLIQCNTPLIWNHFSYTFHWWCTSSWDRKQIGYHCFLYFPPLHHQQKQEVSCINLNQRQNWLFLHSDFRSLMLSL